MKKEPACVAPHFSLNNIWVKKRNRLYYIDIRGLVLKTYT